MNIDVIEPLDRIRISSNEIKNNKISAIYKHSVDQANEQQQLFVGLTNGDLLIYNAVKDTFWRNRAKYHWLIQEQYWSQALFQYQHTRHIRILSDCFVVMRIVATN